MQRQVISAANDPAPRERLKGIALPLILLVMLVSIFMIVPGAKVSALSPDTREASGDFSTFSHTATHAALPCLICHRRENSSTRPSLPGHTPCAGCHTQRFTDPSSPICTICHSDAGAGTVKAFPQLKSFAMRFDHARHTTGSAQAACATCHQPVRRGVALSIPSGSSAHATCYQCHTPGTKSSGGSDISSCATCHTPGSPARTSTWASAYKVSFSHARHKLHAVSCIECHSIRPGANRSAQVTAPQPLMHHASAGARSCATCHNNKRAFGTERFGDCTRCHQSNHFYF
ncbi:MAG: hypothetical protein QOJ64_847 [Acidobacteriota bacterium]|jgi:c(7)-type cytochrome triheme protein|nr:hypothetical protein [Acidobacteriota bacterium]